MKNQVFLSRLFRFVPIQAGGTRTFIAWDACHALPPVVGAVVPICRFEAVVPPAFLFRLGGLWRVAAGCSSWGEGPRANLGAGAGGVRGCFLLSCVEHFAERDWVTPSRRLFPPLDAVHVDRAVSRKFRCRRAGRGGRDGPGGAFGELKSARPHCAEVDAFGSDPLDFKPSNSSPTFLNWFLMIFGLPESVHSATWVVKERCEKSFFL